MTVTIECSCGARIDIDDGSELITEALITLWHTYHGDHRQTLDEVVAKLDRIHQPRFLPEAVA